LSSNRAQLTAAGVIALVFSLLITLDSIESTFNRIWRVPESRPRLVRFLVYWTVLTLGALLAAASLAMSAKLFALPLFETQQGRMLANLVLTLAPVVIELFAITAIYRVVPHRTIKLRYAFVGASLATLLLEVIKWGLGVYLSNFNSYQTLYGPLAVVPILMMWIYLCWVAILIGASAAATSAAFRYQPASMRLPVGFELYGLLRMIGRFHQARARGEGLSDDRLLELEPMLTDALVQEFLAALCRIKLVRCDENGEWILSRDLESVTLSELYEAAQLRVPVSEAHLPFQDDALGQSVRNALNRLRMPMRDLLKHKVAEIYPSPAELSSS
jgi:membrane protein